MRSNTKLSQIFYVPTAQDSENKEAHVVGGLMVGRRERMIKY